MKTRSTLASSLLLLALASRSLSAAPLGSAFTYQGQLTDGGHPAQGIYDLRFTLYDDPTSGSVVAGPITNSPVSVSNGLFTVTLDFGTGVFDSSARWLEIAVRTNSGGTFTPLAPRQSLSPTPYALYAPNAGVAGNATYVTGPVAASQLTGTISSNNLGIGSITGTMLAAGAVTSASIADGAVGSAQLASNLTFQGGGVLPWQEVTNSTLQAESNKGYVVNSPGQVAITLPPSPAVGDIVRVSGGAGGWKVLQNPSQAIRLDQIEPLLGRGVTWTAREANPLDPLQHWVSVASSADGSRLIAAGRVGDPFSKSGLYISTDSGVTWSIVTWSADTPNLFEIIRGWTSVASSADGTTLAAASFGDMAAQLLGLIFISTDSGKTWAYGWAPSGDWSSVASSADGTKMVAAQEGYDIYTSTDSGTTWTRCYAGGLPWISVATSADGNKLVAAASNNQIYRSTDSGVTWTPVAWTPRAPGGHWVSVASSADGNSLVAAVTDGQIYTSTDSGVTWTTRGERRRWTSVASSADGRCLIAAATDRVYTSTDSGVTWIAHEGPRSWTSVASSADGGKLVAAEDGGRIYTSESTPIVSGTTTTPGSTGYLEGAMGTAIELLYLGGDQFLPLSHEGTLYGY